MPIANASSKISGYLKPIGVSSLNNFWGFSTFIGNSSRSYIRNFWNQKTAMPVPGHMHKHKRLDSHNKNLYVSLKTEEIICGSLPEKIVKGIVYNNLKCFILDQTLGRRRSLEA